MKNSVFIHISNNQITNKKLIRQAFEILKDGRYQVTIESKNNRSNDQNAYLHGVVIPLVFEGLRDAGFDDVRDKEDAKLVIKTIFLTRKIHSPENGDTIPIIRKTSELTTIEMMQFIDDVIKWAAEYLNVQIPLPNEQIEIFKPAIAQYDYSVNATIIE
jgi:hypothetical protein